MTGDCKGLPRGVWAIGSDLHGATDTRSFLRSARHAQALTLRRPGGTAKEILSALNEFVRAAEFVAVHGHADLALTAGAHAVIAGVRSLPLAVYRDRFPRLLLGTSTHSQEQARRAQEEGAHFLLYGPVWSTPEKLGILAPRGIPALERICALGLPVIAIGGITSAARVRQCMEVGAYGLAVLRAARDQDLMQILVTAAASAPGVPEVFPDSPPVATPRSDLH